MKMEEKVEKGDPPGEMDVAESRDVADVEEGDVAEGDGLGKAERGRDNVELKVSMENVSFDVETRKRADTHHQPVPSLPHLLPLVEARHRVDVGVPLLRLRILNPEHLCGALPRRREPHPRLLDEIERVRGGRVGPVLDEAETGKVEESERFGVGVLVREFDVEQPEGWTSQLRRRGKTRRRRGVNESDALSLLKFDLLGVAIRKRDRKVLLRADVGLCAMQGDRQLRECRNRTKRRLDAPHASPP